MKTIVKDKKNTYVNVGFFNDINFINKKLVESEKSPIQSLESSYLEGWKK